MRSRLTHRDRAEMTAVLAGLAETETTVICDGIGCKRALLTGRIDDLDRVRVRLRRIRIRILAAGEPDSPLKNLSFLIDAATPGRTRTRRNFHRELLLRFFIYIIFPEKLRKSLDDGMLQLYRAFIICNHISS